MNIVKKIFILSSVLLLSGCYIPYQRLNGGYYGMMPYYGSYSGWWQQQADAIRNAEQLQEDMIRNAEQQREDAMRNTQQQEEDAIRNAQQRQEDMIRNAEQQQADRVRNRRH